MRNKLANEEANEVKGKAGTGAPEHLAWRQVGEDWTIILEEPDGKNSGGTEMRDWNYGTPGSWEYAANVWKMIMAAQVTNLQIVSICLHSTQTHKRIKHVKGEFLLN